MNIIRDIWLCEDCVFASVYDDFLETPHGSDDEGRERDDKDFDYDWRDKEIRAGLRALPGLVPDDSEDHWECRDCGHIQHIDQFQLLVDLDDDPCGRLCPECHSDNTRERDSGNDDFSYSACDCCGSTLGGKRMRFAQLIHEEETS